MAKRTVRRSVRRQGSERAREVGGHAAVRGGQGSLVPLVLVKAVNGVEVVAVGALWFARDVLVTTVSGAANVGAEALTATLSGARGVVSAASRMVGDVVVTAQRTFRDTVDDVRRARPGEARRMLRDAAAGSVNGTRSAATPGSTGQRRSRRRTRRQRSDGRVASARAAA